MNTCKTCRDWTPPDTGRINGTCNSSIVNNDVSRAGVELPEFEDYPTPDLKTGADFGCVHHAAAERHQCQ